KCCRKLDLLLRERTHLSTHRQEYADWHSLSQNRNAENSVDSSPAYGIDVVVRFSLSIEDLDGFALKRHATGCAPKAGLEPHGQHFRVDVSWKPAVCRVLVDRIFQTNDRYNVRLAEPRRRLNERIQHCLKIERRTTDDLEHICGSGLLLQRFTKLV